MWGIYLDERMAVGWYWMSLHWVPWWTGESRKDHSQALKSPQEIWPLLNFCCCWLLEDTGQFLFWSSWYMMMVSLTFIFYTIYFDHVPPRSSPLLYPPNLMYFLFQNNKKVKSKQIKKTMGICSILGNIIYNVFYILFKDAYMYIFLHLITFIMCVSV